MFSARQVAVAALLSNVTRASVFLGRLNRGLRAERIGEAVTLAAQRLLRKLREPPAAITKTELIVAGVRQWQTLVDTAGCDAMTAPLGAILGLFEQEQISAESIVTRIDSRHEGNLRLQPAVLQAFGPAKLARLYQVEEEFIEFLLGLQRSAFGTIRSGTELVERFAQAGFGDLFFSPLGSDWAELSKDRLPDLAAPLTHRLAADTLFSLLAFADFTKYQEALDVQLAPGSQPETASQGRNPSS
jgi:transaldolase